VDEIRTKSLWNVEKCEWEYPDEYKLYKHYLGFAVHLAERIRRVLINECVVRSEFVPEALNTLRDLEMLVEKAALKTKEEYESDRNLDSDNS